MIEPEASASVLLAMTFTPTEAPAVNVSAIWPLTASEASTVVFPESSETSPPAVTSLPSATRVDTVSTIVLTAMAAPTAPPFDPCAEPATPTITDVFVLES